MNRLHKIDRKRIQVLVGILIGLFVILNMQEWSRIPAGLLIGSGILYSAWRGLKRDEHPNKLIYLVVAAFILRFALGAFWAFVLPEYGYDNPVNNAGYVMEDAFNRDMAAWSLAQSDEPLLSSFQGFSHTDQYGGLLFLSAGIYRYIGGEIHQPLMLIAIFSAVSALGVYFVYVIAEKLFNPKAGILAAWFLMLYPEACLLGSSQMREALIPTLSLFIIYLILQIQEKFSWGKLSIVIMIFLFSVSLSVPFSGLMLIVVAVMLALPFYQKWINGHNKWIAGIITALVFGVSIVTAWLFVGKVYGAWYQQYLSLYGSGKLTAVLERVPEYLHSSIITIYGVFRPLLPAALTSSGNSVWQGIAIWRSLGWAVLLFLLLIVTIKVIKEKKLLHLAGFLTFLNWIWIFLSSYRSGGDMWDNPRYRLFLVGVQILLAAWFISENKAKDKNPWLRRGVIATVLTIGLYMLWYVDRNVFDFGWRYSEIWTQVKFNFQLIIVYLFVDVGLSELYSRILIKYFKGKREKIKK